MATQTRQPMLRGKLAANHKRWVIVVLSLVMFSHIMDFMVMMPLGPQLMRLFQISPQQFSFLISVYSLSAGICGFLGSLIFDRIDRKTALIGAYFGFLIGTLCCAIAPNFDFLLLSRAISGAFGGVLSGICFAIVGDLFPISERGRATSKLMTSFSFAAIMGVPAGLLLSNQGNWHSPFLLIVGIGLIVLVLAKVFIPTVHPAYPTDAISIFSGLTENLFDSNSRRALLTTFGMVLSQFMVIPFISPFLVSNTGFPEDGLFWVYLLGGGLTAFSGPWMGRISDRFGARFVFIRTGLLFLIPVYFLTHLTQSTMFFTLTITSSYFILSNMRMVPAMTIIASSIPASRRGSFMSLNSCVQQLGASSAALLSGWIVSQASTHLPLNGFGDTALAATLFGLSAYFFGQKVKIIS